MGVQLSIYIYQDLCKIGFGTAENEPSKILVTNNIEKSYYLFFAAQMIFLLLLSFLSRAGNLEEEFSAGVLEGAKLAAAGEGLAAEAVRWRGRGRLHLGTRLLGRQGQSLLNARSRRADGEGWLSSEADDLFRLRS